MKDQRSFKAVIRQNRRAVLAVLLLPVIGMLISVPLIFIRAPQKFMITTLIIGLILLQYLLLVFFVMHRMDKLAFS